MPPATLALIPSLVAGWPLQFLAWFLIWIPLVALLEYATHRWIMHMANRLLDPKLRQLKAHGTHHQGTNEDEFVDMPWRNCLLLASPILLLLAAWGVAAGSLASVVIPGAALLFWTILYTYLWTRIHRAIHGVEFNWFARSGVLFRFFRDHHLRHHRHATVNYGTVFPWTDYLLFTWHRPSVVGGSQGKLEDPGPQADTSKKTVSGNEREQPLNKVAEQN